MEDGPIDRRALASSVEPFAEYPIPRAPFFGSDAERRISTPACSRNFLIPRGAPEMLLPRQWAHGWWVKSPRISLNEIAGAIFGMEGQDFRLQSFICRFGRKVFNTALRYPPPHPGTA